jgi:hypothetical protein
MFSTVYRVTEEDFYARSNISVEVRRGTVLLEYETGRYLSDGEVLQHVEVAVSCHCRLHEEKWTDHTMFMQS